MATYNGIKKIKIGDNIFNLYDSGNSGGTITSIKTTAGAHSTINVTSGAANFNVPTTAAHVGIKFGYTTSGNNRAVLQDSSGNLYVTQKDDNTTYYLQTYTTRQTDADVAWHSNNYVKYLLATSSMTTNKPTFTGDGVAKRTSDGMILHLSWDNNGGWDTQIAIPNSGGMISTRGGTGKDGDVQAWTDWVSYARADKAISDITRSGTTFTATRADGTTFTFTQQDNNTTYSASTGLSLSSNAFSLAKITKNNTTSTASPAHSGTFTAIDTVTYDDYGRVTGVNTKTITLPASGNTDAKVTQSATTTSDWRKVLVHYTTNTSGADVPASVTNQVYAAKGIEVQPSTGTLHAEALTTKKITPLITGGSQTAAVTTSPYKPALWKFNAGIVPANGNIVVIQAPGGGHSYGEFLSLDNGTTYKPITHSGTNKMTTHYANGSPIALVYDSDWTASSMYPLAGGTSTGTISGGAWRVINGYLDGNTYPQAQCETAAATAAKAASMTNFTATANRYIMVNIRYANTSATAITLNINSTGNKPIYINGSASSTSNYTLPAGSYLVYYNGTNYYFRTDGALPVKTSTAVSASDISWLTAAPTTITAPTWPSTATGTLVFEKWGRVVCCKLTALSKAATGSNLVYTTSSPLPEKYRPYNAAARQFIYDSTCTICIIIYTDGRVDVYNYGATITSAVAAKGTLTYIAANNS